MDPARDRLRFLLDTVALGAVPRTLRNRMAHEYIRLPELLAQAVNEAHTAIPMPVSFVRACHTYAAARGMVAAVGTARDGEA